MTLRSFRDLEAICRHLKLLPAKLDCPSVNSSRVKCYAYSLFTHGGYPAWVINTVPFAVAINYIRYSDLVDILQAKVKCHLLVGPAHPVPRVSNKHYSACNGPNNVSFMYIP